MRCIIQNKVRTIMNYNCGWEIGNRYTQQHKINYMDTNKFDVPCAVKNMNLTVLMDKTIGAIFTWKNIPLTRCPRRFGVCICTHIYTRMYYESHIIWVCTCICAFHISLKELSCLWILYSTWIAITFKSLRS